MRATKKAQPKRRGRDYSPIQNAPAAVVSAPAGFVLPSDRAAKDELAALRREHKELREALFEAEQVHRKLCAPRELRRGAFEVAGEMFAVRHLSGDFLNVLDLGSSVGLALGDVAGKGISAGLWVAHLVSLARKFLASHTDPSEAAAAINRDLCSLAVEPPLVALFLGHLDPLSGQLAYCNAGLPAALLVRREGTVESLQEGGPMLGAVPGAAFCCGRVEFAPGDTLVAFSDGVAECRNAREEEFGSARLAAAVRACGGMSATQSLFSTLGTVLDFSGGRPLDDDLTLMVVHRRGAPATH